jgi:B12-binding domain/radical SAM domain protein
VHAPRILFHKTRKNPNSLAALVGAIEAAQGRSPIAGLRPEAGSDALVLPDLSRWEVGFFGPAGDMPDPPPARDAGLTVLAYSFMTIDLPDVADSVRRMAARRMGTGERLVLIAGGAHATGDPEGTAGPHASAASAHPVPVRFAGPPPAGWPRGGAGGAAAPSGRVRPLGFDHAVVGESEVTLPLFLHRLAAGVSQPRVIRPEHPPLPLDRFLSFAPAHNLLAPIELSRGCPFACKFCNVPAIQGRRMRHRSVESVLAHVEIALARGRVRTWFVTSDAFAYGSRTGELGDRDACERLLAGCRAAGMKEVFWGGFPSEVRPDHVVPELVELVARHCANRTVVIGAQSGSESVLERIGRGHRSRVVLEAVRVVRSFGLVPHVDFILGLPGETLADRRATMELVGSITGEHGGRAHMHYFMPHPGTPYAGALPEPIEPEIVDAVERLTGRRLVDGTWRQQREVAARANPRVLAAAAAAAGPRAGYRGRVGSGGTAASQAAPDAEDTRSTLL